MSDVVIVDRATQWSDQDLATAETVVRNAVRLLEDAALLQTYKRFATAYTLATIAFEEAGKVALSHWGSSPELAQIGKGWSFHLRKQAAAGCLLLAEFAKEVVDEHPARKGRGTLTPGDPVEEADLREHLAKALSTSKPARLMELIAVHAVEKTKHLGFYADEWVIEAGLDAAHFSPTECATAIQEVQTAIRLLRSSIHLQIAQALFLTEPLNERLVAVGREHARRTGRKRAE